MESTAAPPTRPVRGAPPRYLSVASADHKSADFSKLLAAPVKTAAGAVGAAAEGAAAASEDGAAAAAREAPKEKKAEGAGAGAQPVTTLVAAAPAVLAG